MAHAKSRRVPLLRYSISSARIGPLSAPLQAFQFPLVIATEVLGSIAIIVGWKSRITALSRATITLLTAFSFRTKLGDRIQTLMKNVSIKDAFLLLPANGLGPLSNDNRS